MSAGNRIIPSIKPTRRSAGLTTRDLNLSIVGRAFGLEFPVGWNAITSP